MSYYQKKLFEFFQVKERCKMVWENKTILVEFFLKGLSGYPRLELLFLS